MIILLYVCLGVCVGVCVRAQRQKLQLNVSVEGCLWILMYIKDMILYTQTHTRTGIWT